MKKVVLITGGSRGIGAATAKYLARQDYAICITYKSSQSTAENLVAELEFMGSHALAVQADISREEDIVRLFKIVDNELGRMTHLVNNAGILLPQMEVEQMSAERINQTLMTNVTGTFICCREAIKRMATKNGGNGGAIVNISSAASRLGAAGEYVDYAASKGAIDTLTKGLSLELAREGIRVNCVRPGFIHTDIHSAGGEPNRIERVKPKIPMKRGGQPKEVAATIAWLLSDEASYTTGSFVDLAGGA